MNILLFQEVGLSGKRIIVCTCGGGDWDRSMLDSDKWKNSRGYKLSSGRGFWSQRLSTSRRKEKTKW